MKVNILGVKIDKTDMFQTIEKVKKAIEERNSDLCTWYTFGQAILKLSGMDKVRVIPISSKEFGRPAVRPSYSVLNCQKLKKETGLALRPWSEALKDYLATYRLTISREGR